MAKRIFLLIIVYIICLIAIFCMIACDSHTIDTKDIQSIWVREKSLKKDYAVDEEIDFDNVYIVIVFTNDRGQMVEKVEPSMVEGFDTATVTTIGEYRIMRITYLGVYVDWVYTVSSNYDINSYARMSLEKEIDGNILKVNAKLDIGDLTEVYGCQVNVRYNKTKLEYIGVEKGFSDWEVVIGPMRSNGFSLIYHFNRQLPITENEKLFELNFEILKYDTIEIEFIEIKISDGKKDFFLPNAQ